MTEPTPQWFHFGPWVFSIHTAMALITATPRPARRIDVTAWAKAYGLTRLDDPPSQTIGLISPASDGFDRDYAMSTNLTIPVIVASLPIPAQPPEALLIDGTHRLYRAWREGVAQLPAYVLTVAETTQVRRDARLGPDRRRLNPPH